MILNVWTPGALITLLPLSSNYEMLWLDDILEYILKKKPHSWYAESFFSDFYSAFAIRVIQSKYVEN